MILRMNKQTCYEVGRILAGHVDEYNNPDE